MQLSARRAVIAGASGFIGARLVHELSARGYELRIVGRSGPVSWADQPAIDEAVNDAELLINLAGKNVGCRYSDAARNEILRSRVDTTRMLHRAVAAAGHPPKLWLNASTATIYRHAMDRPNTESNGEIGEGFSVDVARNWEQEFLAGELTATRRVALRMAIVLGDGPASQKLLGLAKWGIGGPQIDGWWPAHRRYRGIGPEPTGPEKSGYYPTRGQQRFSWIHIDDVIGAIWHLIEHSEIRGPVNLSSPHPVTNTELMSSLRRVAGRRFGIPAYRWMLEPAMFVLRVEPEMLLKSRWVLPETLEGSGYEFKWPELNPALADVAK
ncbi:epimerase [Glutamicibacter arilaitensis]|uniref:epimerase n=1 Tax=Glutamicibacter arilaitensis TaxID=256701 RepID=UPI0038512C24